MKGILQVEEAIRNKATDNSLKLNKDSGQHVSAY